jgi:hypothetical protein
MPIEMMLSLQRINQVAIQWMKLLNILDAIIQQ